MIKKFLNREIKHPAKTGQQIPVDEPKPIPMAKLEISKTPTDISVSILLMRLEALEQKVNILMARA